MKGFIFVKLTLNTFKHDEKNFVKKKKEFEMSWNVNSSIRRQKNISLVFCKNGGLSIIS